MAFARSYVPPEDALGDLVEGDLQLTVAMEVDAAIDELLDKDALVEEILEDLGEELRIEDVETFIRQQFDQDPDQSWRGVIDVEHRAHVHTAREKIKRVIRRAL